MKIRIGTLYRNALIKYFKKTDVDGAVLDIGCHDGLLLDEIKARVKIGVDISPGNVGKDIAFVQADANFLPFKINAFKQIFIMDVIEHIEKDYLLSRSLCRVLKPSGSIFLSTPSKDIRLFPDFLTDAISKKWGHIYRKGYTKRELDDLFNNEFVLNIYEWNARWWRFFYLPIRVLAELSSGLTSQMIKQIFTWDAKNSHGIKGYILFEGTKIHD